MDRSEWVLVPRKLTAENGAKAALLGEFSVRDSIPCPDCDTPDDDCEHCEGLGLVTYEIAVPWDTIKRIHEAIVALSPPPPAEQASGELIARLREARTDLDETIMPDHAEPFGADCGLLREAEEMIAALSQRPLVDEDIIASTLSGMRGSEVVWDEDRRTAKLLVSALAPQQPEKG